MILINHHGMYIIFLWRSILYMPYECHVEEKLIGMAGAFIEMFIVGWGSKG